MKSLNHNLHARKIVINIDGNCVPQNNKTDLHNNKNRDTVVSNSRRARNKNRSRILAVNAFHRYEPRYDFIGLLNAVTEIEIKTQGWLTRYDLYNTILLCYWSEFKTTIHGK